MSSSPSPPPPPESKRPFSIDLSLELEQELENELVTSPMAGTHDTGNDRRESLDPQVLASIIMQLNQDKARLEKERDDLVQQLSTAHEREAGLTDSLDLMTSKCTTMEEELTEARTKAKDDEEAITLLRSKVEESRRGLMRLQTENRRSSVAPGPLDLSRASLASFASLGSSKRQSFTPLTGTLATSRAHRRTSSHSDHNGLPTLTQEPPQISSSPNGQLVFSDTASVASVPVTSRRFSGFFPPGRQSPPDQYDPISAELDGLRRELQSTKDELLDLKHELSEAIEAKEASEQCSHALRDFIAEHNVGVANLDSAANPDKPTRPGHQQKKSSGWGFGSLWASAPKPPSIASEPDTPVAAPSTQGDSPATKFGGLFGSRKPQLTSDVSCTSTVSDTSSVDNDEPRSPTAESINVIVRDPSRSSTSSEYAHVVEIPTKENVGVVAEPVAMRS